MRKVELYRAHEQLDLEDTELFIEHLMNHRKNLLERQDAASAVHAEAAAVVLPAELVSSLSRGPARDPNSARSLAEGLLKTQGRFTKAEFRNFLKEKRPTLGPAAVDTTLSVIFGSGFAKKSGCGDAAVFTLASESN